MVLMEELKRLKNLGDAFYEKGIEDIYTNSKIYEILIAEYFGHKIINGHAKSPDATDGENLYEYKHFKLSSSNHTWTFNDFSAFTINKLSKVKEVYFVIIDDESIIPDIQKVYVVEGKEVAKYLRHSTLKIENKRKMINISPNQILKNMNYYVIRPEGQNISEELKDVFYTARRIEDITGVRGILTSNKLWELLVAVKLGHKINPDQKKHDACDGIGTYEYKISKKRSWTFQDISENVLNSYLQDEKIVLVVVDKKRFIIKRIYLCSPREIVVILQDKLLQLKKRKKNIRRLVAAINAGDIQKLEKRGAARCLH